MSSTQSPFEDPSHSAPPTGIRGMFRALSQEYEILLKKYKDTTRDQNFLVNASTTNKKEITNAGNVANQCREWVHDCKKTLQSLEESLRLVINKKEAQAAVVRACKRPEPDNVHLAMKEISDADKRITALQTQIRGYVDALRQWLDKRLAFKPLIPCPLRFLELRSFHTDVQFG
ncbi:hypothetical protein FNYG_10991 [Fusarium nygamai]|uniref:Uncharacterized protein n=1 Tax=Gibberella nygamai TaxID=42673 RepID=A0A2K0VZX5_GIBNY|nr:hypothetical protein FNYG_10991 [Fusarium nygamai]